VSQPETSAFRPAARGPLQLHQARAQEAQRGRNRVARASRAISHARLAVALGAGVSLVWALAEGTDNPWAWLIAGILALIFGILVIRHAGVERDLARWTARLEFNEEAAFRIQRHWEGLPWIDEEPDSHHAYAHDLDVFGRVSLMRLLGGGETPPGRQQLAGWLLSPSPPEEVLQRQAAVRELAPLVDFREEAAVRARTGGAWRTRLEPFLTWAEGRRWLLEHRWLLWASRLLPLATISLAALQIVGMVPAAFWLAPLTAGVVLTFLYREPLQATIEQASSRADAIRRYGELFEWWESRPFEAGLLRELQRRLAGAGAGHAAHVEMKRLERSMGLADLRHAALMHFPINALTLWDFHVAWLFDHWRQRSGRAVRAWTGALGTADALSALAGLLHDQPSWTMPAIGDRSWRPLEATAIGHPYLADEVRVTNDVEMGPAGTCLLVTGSNMSGKSTLLRAIGVNVVLAQAGGPVCAASMRLPAVRLETSMRVSDSLAEGVSYFMAALRRLKQIVDTARQVEHDEAWTVLFLLDEILQGTNSAERRLAVRGVVRHLVAHKAIGAITTHDLALPTERELATIYRPVYFTETLSLEDGQMRMTFDYRLRPGLATSTNALKLMQLIGLEEVVDEGAD
jgi:hypothetical protein